MRVLPVLIFLLFAAHCAAAGCVPVKQGLSEPNAFRYGPSHVSPGATYIDKPGQYCLSEDLRVAGHYFPITPEGPRLFSDDELLLRIDTSDVSLDFNGHTASSDARLLSGVTTRYGALADSNSESAQFAPPRNITIRGGRIEVSRHGMAVEFLGAGPREQLVNIVNEMTGAEIARYGNDLMMLGIEQDRRARLRASVLPDAAAYPDRSLRIEHMHIRAKDDAVVLQGAGSVVRDNVIETDSGTALWLFGPGAVIENNTFIVHCQSQAMTYEGVSHCQDMDAPIRLMHGDGAVIRNNRFVLKDHAFQRAVSLFDTGAVIFEGNTFIGLKDVRNAVVAFRGPRLLAGTQPNLIDGSWSSWLRNWY